MAHTVFGDESQTAEVLRSMTCLMAWMRSVPQERRHRLVAAIADCSDEARDVVLRLVSVVENPQATPAERQQAVAAIANALSLNSDAKEDDLSSQQAAFADRLRDLMAQKCITQQQLAHRIGCTQPAISQMLNRRCRPQKQTILKLAEALNVQPQDLWPDLEVADLLDAVSSFQHDDYAMTEAEAKSLRDTARRNAPKIPVRPLPARRPRGAQG